MRSCFKCSARIRHHSERCVTTSSRTPGPNHRSGYLVTQTQALEVGFLAETEGTYSIEVYADPISADAVSEEGRRSIFVNVREESSD